MAYQVYLLESLDVNNWIELDCEGVDFSTTFAVAQVADIANRTDSITKHISFKGTKTNNMAFGTFFHQNVSADFELDNRLFFNYNPLRLVDCLIYENSALLLKGSLRITAIDADINGCPIYETVITGSFINFKDAVQTLLTDDLDFSNLKHRYTWNNIRDSWDLRTERFEGTDYSYQPFQKGSGYVYPFIDYGHVYKDIDASTNPNFVPVKNFRPAIYLKEYFDRIFSQEELAGYSYEIKGSDDLIQRFNSLVIPSNVEKLSTTSSQTTKAYSTTDQIRDQQRTVIDNDGTTYTMYRYLNLEHQDNPDGLISAFGNYLPGDELPNCVYLVNREFVSDGYVSVHFKNIFNHYSKDVKVSIQLCERDFVGSGAGFDDTTWNVIQTSRSITIPKNAGLNNITLDMEVGERTYDETSQLCLRIIFENASFFLEFVGIFGHVDYTVNTAELRFAKDSNSVITYGLDIDDEITPVAVQGIKQMDFIKSVINLFNFYVYTENVRPKHLIFQTYDDYYALSSLNLLSSTALDWSAKIDYSKPPKIKPNIDLPKSYYFTFKDDSDFINKDYKTKSGEVYGTFKFNDSYGVQNEKKVELIFSPSPLVQYKGTGRVHPAIYSNDNGQKKPIKSNTRILFYNGIKSCQPFIVGKDIVTDASYSVETLASDVSVYPQVGNYYIAAGVDNTTVLGDMYFGFPQLFYFDSTADYVNAPTGYQNYYRNQITELTKPNISFITCQVYLNEIDIANLDLRTPVFVDFGKWGHHYYKVLSVEYYNNGEVSDVQLQKISI